MSGTRYFVRAEKAAAEELYSELERAFEEDGHPLSINEVEPARDGMWEISVYAVDGTDSLVTSIRQVIKSIAPGISVNEEELPDIDWVSHALEGLKSVRAGRVVLHGSHDKPVNASADIAIEIDAGQAFGTGHHGTTWGCLKIIQSVLKQSAPRSALDVGTGSAVLAIAIAKLARIPVLATDSDPVAISVAAENIVRNGAIGIDTAVATGFRHRRIAAAKPYDLIVANILARPLMGMAPEMARHLSQGGDAILSGVLLRQRRALIAAFVNNGFRHIRTLEREGWVTLHLRR